MTELTVISSVLTEDYLSERLSNWFGKEVKYTSHEFCGGTAKGDSYLSDVYRIIFCGKLVSPNSEESPEVSIKVILKSFPLNIARRKTFRSHTFFSNEINFYEIILPKLLKFQAEKKVTHPFTNYPKVFASTTNGVDDFLAMEDLTTYGYGGAVRQEGIDYAHCQKILETFAKFHALSFAFKDQHPREYEEMAKKVPEVYYDSKYWEWYRPFWKLLCVCAIDAVEKEFPNTIYEEKIKDFATEKTYEKMSAAAHDNSKSAVIGHGDSWTPNFMFKYRDGTNIPEDSVMIDFQLSRSGSPILDIAFFIYACSTEKLRNEKYHDMLKYYYEVLATQIREMGTDPDEVYSWDYYMEEVKKYSFFGLGFSMESTPVIILEPDEAFEMDSLTGTEAVEITQVWNIKPIKSQAGRLRLAGIVKHAVDNGYI